MSLKFVGFDPSLRNWGYATGNFSVDVGISLDSVGVIQTTRDQNKQTRNNSKDLDTAFKLFDEAYKVVKDADAVFVEVPIGSQSARAMASYGICIGILGGLRSLGVPIYEVTPTEVKLATVGSKTASKKEMIEWAHSKYAHLNWPKSYSGELVEGKAEHMADAIGAIYAGILTQDFKRLVSFIQNSRKAS